jgi:hypothetical protein
MQRSSATPSRPSHPAPYVRDDRETPLRGDGIESVYCCFYQPVKQNSEIPKLYSAASRIGSDVGLPAIAHDSTPPVWEFESQTPRQTQRFWHDPDFGASGHKVISTSRQLPLNPSKMTQTRRWQRLTLSGSGVISPCLALGNSFSVFRSRCSGDGHG